MLLLHGIGRISWITNDCGKTVQTIYHGKKAFRFLYHPVFDSYLLGLFEHPNCKGRKCKVSGVVSLSRDWGKNWTIIRNDVLDFSW